MVFVEAGSHNPMLTGLTLAREPMCLLLDTSDTKTSMHRSGAGCHTDGEGLIFELVGVCEVHASGRR